MITATYNALKAAIESADDVDGRVYDSFRKNADGTFAREQYVILYASAPIATRSGRYTGVPTWDALTADWDYRVKFVGVSAAAVLELMDRVVPQLTGVVLTVAGRRNDPISVTASGVLVPITEVKSVMYSGDLRVRFTSHPA